MNATWSKLEIAQWSILIIFISKAVWTNSTIDELGIGQIISCYFLKFTLINHNLQGFQSHQSLQVRSSCFSYVLLSALHLKTRQLRIENRNHLWHKLSIQTWTNHFSFNIFFISIKQGYWNIKSLMSTLTLKFQDSSKLID